MKTPKIQVYIIEQKGLTRRQQQFGGLFILILSLIGIVGIWYMALFKGYFYAMPSAAGPAFLFLGIGLILFPDYRAERTARGKMSRN